METLVGLLLLLIFLAVVVAVVRGQSPIIMLIILAIGWSAIAGIGIGDIQNKILQGGGTQYASAVIVIVFGAWFAQILIQTGIAESVIRSAVELAGDRPVVTAMTVTLVTALLVVAGLCLVTVVALQPLRGRFDTDRNPAQPLSPADIRANVASVLRDPALRTLCIAMFSFVGLQSLFTGFFVLYLVRGLGYDLERAGIVFAIAVAVAVPARIGWGWLASRLVKPATLLALLGIAMAGAAVLTGLIDPVWPTWAATGIAIAFSVTAVSWHGVLLAEVARLSPSGRIGATTGAVLAFGDAGSLVLPLMFTAALSITGGYGIGFLIGGILALGVGTTGLWRRVNPAAAG